MQIEPASLPAPPTPRERPPPPSRGRVTAAQLPGAQTELRQGRALNTADVLAATSGGEAGMAETASLRPQTMLPIIPHPPKTAPPAGWIPNPQPNEHGPPPGTGRSNSSRASERELLPPTSRAAMGRALRKSVAAAHIKSARRESAFDNHTSTPAQLMARMEEAAGDSIVRTVKGSDAQVIPEEQFRLSLEQQLKIGRHLALVPPSQAGSMRCLSVGLPAA